MSDRKTIILNGKRYIEFKITANLTKKTYRTFYKSSDGAVVYNENSKPVFRNQTSDSIIIPRAHDKASMKKDR